MVGGLIEYIAEKLSDILSFNRKYYDQIGCDIELIPLKNILNSNFLILPKSKFNESNS